jgi:uncharacterized protein
MARFFKSLFFKDLNPAPFVHKFETPKGKYIYDVNSNRVFQVSPITYDLIDEFGQSKIRHILKKFPQYGRKEIKGCLEEIKKSRKLGNFSSQRPEKMFFDFEGSVEELIQKSSHQQLILNVTEQCNLHCHYCAFSGRYPHRRNHSQREMSFEIARKAVDHFLKNPEEEIHISFYGGEPLLKLSLIKKTVDYVISQTRKKVNWNLTTNGLLLTPEVWDFFHSNQFKIMVSLDGPPEIQDRYRQDPSGRGTFDRIMRNLVYIREKDPDYYKTNVTFSVVCSPPFKMNEVCRFFTTDDRVRGNMVNFSYMDDGSEGFEYLPEETDFATLRENNEDLSERYVEQLKAGQGQDNFLKALNEQEFVGFYHREKTSLGKRIHLNGCCIPGFRRLFVSTEGILHVCERFDYAYPIGNCEGWINPQQVERLVKDYIDFQKDCLTCWGSRLCSVCFASFKTQKGKFFLQHREDYCQNQLERMHALLVNYYSVFEENPSALDFLGEMTVD